MSMASNLFLGRRMRYRANGPPASAPSDPPRGGRPPVASSPIAYHSGGQRRRWLTCSTHGPRCRLQGLRERDRPWPAGDQRRRAQRRAPTTPSRASRATGLTPGADALVTVEWGTSQVPAAGISGHRAPRHDRRQRGVVTHARRSRRPACFDGPAPTMANGTRSRTRPSARRSRVRRRDDQMAAAPSPVGHGSASPARSGVQPCDTRAQPVGPAVGWLRPPDPAATPRSPRCRRIRWSSPPARWVGDGPRRAPRPGSRRHRQPLTWTIDAHRWIATGDAGAPPASTEHCTVTSTGPLRRLPHARRTGHPVAPEHRSPIGVGVRARTPSRPATAATPPIDDRCACGRSAAAVLERDTSAPAPSVQTFCVGSTRARATAPPPHLMRRIMHAERPERHGRRAATTAPHQAGRQAADRCLLGDARSHGRRGGTCTR